MTALTLVVVMIAVSALVTQRLVLRAEHHADELATELSIVQHVRLQAEQLVSASRGYLLTGREQTAQRLDQLDREFDRSLQELELRANAREEPRTELSRTATTYMTAIRFAARERVATGDPAAILDVFEERIMPMRRRFEAAADEYVRQERAQAARSQRAAQSIANDAHVTLVVLMVAGLSLALALAWLVSRKLLTQYHEVELATAAARGATARRDEVLAIVSHDLRTPLSTVVLGATVLGESNLTSQQQRAVSSINAAAERMRHLIDELLAREQLESGTIVLDLGRHDAQAIVSTVLDLVRDRARERHVELRESTSALDITADRERLLQVLSNLVGNALKFARSGDSIEVTSREEADAVRFEVRDTGPGIPAEQIPRLFDRYFQGTKQREHGSLGLGLYICKRIVEAHGGTIGVKSTPGQGTTAWFTIPISLSPSVGSGSRQEASSTANTSLVLKLNDEGRP